MCEEVDNIDYRVTAWLATADAQTEAGDMNQARELISKALGAAAETSDTNERDRFLVRIAEVQARSEHVNGAIDTARRIRASRRRVTALGVIAFIQAQAGDLDQAQETVGEALATANEIPESDWQISARIYIAAVQRLTGDTERFRQTIGRAMAAAKKIVDVEWRANVLAMIAASLPN